jgi:hypothetical protein
MGSDGMSQGRALKKKRRTEAPRAGDVLRSPLQAAGYSPSSSWSWLIAAGWAVLETIRMGGPWLGSGLISMT